MIIHVMNLGNDWKSAISSIRAAEMEFLRKVHSATLYDKVRSCEIREALNVKLLFLRIERSQLQWSGKVATMSQARLTRQALLVKPTWKRSRGRPRTRWHDYIAYLAWSGLGVEWAELSDIAKNREVFQALLWLLPLDIPESKGGHKNDEWVLDHVVVQDTEFVPSRYIA